MLENWQTHYKQLFNTASIQLSFIAHPQNCKN